MTQFLTRFLRDEEGASLVEYSVLIGLVTAAVITLVLSVGDRVEGAWSKLDSEMDKGGMTKAAPAGG